MSPVKPKLGSLVAENLRRKIRIKHQIEIFVPGSQQKIILPALPARFPNLKPRGRGYVFKRDGRDAIQGRVAFHQAPVLAEPNRGRRSEQKENKRGRNDFHFRVF